METTITSQWEELQSAAAERGIALFQGLPVVLGSRGQQDSARTATWTGNLLGFLDVAKAAGIVLAYVLCDVLDYEDVLIAFVKDVNPDFDPKAEPVDKDESAQSLFERLKARSREYAERHGHACSVQCVWVKEGIHHTFESYAPWYDDLFETLTAVTNEAHLIGEERRILLSAADSERINDLAEKLARHPRFGEAQQRRQASLRRSATFPERRKNRRGRFGRRDDLLVGRRAQRESNDGAKGTRSLRLRHVDAGDCRDARHVR